MTITAHGKVCYLMLPAKDVAESAEFYRKVFHWKIRSDNHGHTSFDDTGEVSGMWLTGLPPVNAGFLHIMVADIEGTCARVVEHGGSVVKHPDMKASEVVAEIRDPAGNVFALYGDPALRKK